MRKALLPLPILAAWACLRPYCAWTEPSDSSQGLLPAAGIVLEPEIPGPRLSASVPDSSAQALGLKEGDRLLYLNGFRTENPPDAAPGSTWTPGARAWAVVERSGQVLVLSCTLPRAETPSPRQASALTASERRFQHEHMAQAGQAVPQRVKDLRAAALRVAAGEKTWIRFPKGIPIGLAEGDVIEGLTSASLAADSTLDFIAIPAGSQVWAQALAVQESKGVRLIRLHVYKIRLKGGHFYPCSAVITDVSGNQSLLKASVGGTVVASEPEQGLYAVEPARDFQISFLKPLSIREPADFYAAGPGLWLRGSAGAAAFEITHVIPRRSADAAGLKVGDRVEAIAGASARKLDFAEATLRLYGPVGSSVRLRVARADKGVPEDVTLTRGVEYKRKSGEEIREPLSIGPRITAF